VSGPSRGQSSHRDSVSDPAEGVHRTAHRDPAHAAWRRRAARGHARPLHDHTRSTKTNLHATRIPGPLRPTRSPHDDAFRFRELIVAMKHEFTRFASRVRAETTEQIHTWHCIEPSKLLILLLRYIYNPYSIRCADRRAGHRGCTAGRTSHAEEDTRETSGVFSRPQVEAADEDVSPA
jgi:hypothetical protein